MSLSWIVFGTPDGAFFGSHKLGDNELETIDIAEQDGGRRARAKRYAVLPTGIAFKDRTFSDSNYRSTDQRWYQSGAISADPKWVG